MTKSPAKKPRPTHAGGIVYRRRKGQIEFLMVTAKRARGVWVYPKGHVEKGETVREAAAREVLEEAGVRAEIEGKLAELSYEVAGNPVRVRYYLMAARNNGSPQEGRKLKWLSVEAALKRVRFENARRLLQKADRKARRSRPPAGRSPSHN